jgi:hypothetical protein
MNARFISFSKAPEEQGDQETDPLSRQNKHALNLYQQLNPDSMKGGDVMGMMCATVEVAVNAYTGLTGKENVITLENSVVVCETPRRPGEHLDLADANTLLEKAFNRNADKSYPLERRASASVLGNRGHYAIAVMRDTPSMGECISQLNFADSNPQPIDMGIRGQMENLLSAFLVKDHGPEEVESCLKELKEGKRHLKVAQQLSLACAEHAVLNAATKCAQHMGWDTELNTSDTRASLLRALRDCVTPSVEVTNFEAVQAASFDSAVQIVLTAFNDENAKNPLTKLRVDLDNMLSLMGEHGHNYYFEERAVDLGSTSSRRSATRNGLRKFFMIKGAGFKLIVKAMDELRQKVHDCKPNSVEFKLGETGDSTEFFTLLMEASSALRGYFTYEEGSTKDVNSPTPSLREQSTVMWVCPPENSKKNKAEAELSVLLRALKYGSTHTTDCGVSFKDCLGDPPQCLVVSIRLQDSPGPFISHNAKGSDTFKGSCVSETWSEVDFRIAARIFWHDNHYVVIVSAGFDKEGITKKYYIANDLRIEEGDGKKCPSLGPKWGLVAVFGVQTKYFDRPDSDDGFEFPVTPLPRNLGAAHKYGNGKVDHIGMSQGKTPNTCYQNVVFQSIRAVKHIIDGYKPGEPSNEVPDPRFHHFSLRFLSVIRVVREVSWLSISFVVRAPNYNLSLAPSNRSSSCGHGTCPLRQLGVNSRRLPTSSCLSPLPN